MTFSVDQDNKYIKLKFSSKTFFRIIFFEPSQKTNLLIFNDLSNAMFSRKHYI